MKTVEKELHLQNFNSFQLIVCFALIVLAAFSQASVIPILHPVIVPSGAITQISHPAVVPVPIVVAPAHGAVYTAINRGTVHQVPLPGHAISQTHLNLAPAPGTV